MRMLNSIWNTMAEVFGSFGEITSLFEEIFNDFLGIANKALNYAG